MEKPTFDPNQPFSLGGLSNQGDTKPKFDYSKPFQVHDENTSSDERPWYAFDPKNLGAGFIQGLKTIDEYTGAPIRKFVTETLTGKELDHAPSGAEQAKMLGASDKTYKETLGVPSWLGGDISPADIYGVGLEMVQDPFVLASGVKSAVKASQPVVESAVKSLSKVVPVTEGVSAFKFKAPESLEELRNWKPKAETGILPGKERLKEIVNTVPDLETKPLKYHFDMMENPKAMKELKLKFENLPTSDAKKIAQYNQQIVDESTNKIGQTINDIAGQEPRTLSEAGNDFIGAVKDQYQKEKQALGPIFEEVKKRAPVMNKTDAHDLIIALGENTKIGKILEQSPETGKFTLGKNTPRTGLSDEEHRVLGRVIDDLNDGMRFDEIQKTREFLRKSIDPANPAAHAEVQKVRSIMLGKLEDMADKINPEIGQTFRDYAINERSRESIEKIIGGSIDSLDRMYAANPEKVVQKIFSNPNYTQVVKNYVGPEKMNEMISSFVSSGLDKATDSAKGFSPEKFRSWLKRNDNILSNNLPEETLNRLNALSDYGYYGKRFLDEVNPSGTAASLKEMIEPGNIFDRVKKRGVVGGIVSQGTDTVQDIIKSKNAKSNLDQLLGNKPIPKQPIDKTKALSKLAQGAAVGRVLDREKENQKGLSRWTNDGFDKFTTFANEQNDQELSNILENLDKTDPKIQRVLIEASTFNPNSKGFKNAVLKIKKISGE